MTVTPRSVPGMSPDQAAPVVANPIRTGDDWHTIRDACQRDPGAWHGAIAAEMLHWYVPAAQA